MKKKGRGLSYDEKRDKMLKIFHDSVTHTAFRNQFLIMNKSKNYQSRLEFLFQLSKKYSALLKLIL
jgi:hypothetical protein